MPDLRHGAGAVDRTRRAGRTTNSIDMTRRFWIGLVLSVPVFALEMGGHLIGLHMLHGRQLSNWIQFVLATPVVLVGGLAVLRARLAIAADPQSQHVHADRHGHRRRLDLQRRRDTASAAFSRLPSAADGSVAVYFEAAAVITVLVLLGQVLELRARDADLGRHQGAA